VAVPKGWQFKGRRRRSGLLETLAAIGFSICRREVRRLLIGRQDELLTETRDVPRALSQTPAR
jgi:hypothetical protein